MGASTLRKAMLAGVALVTVGALAALAQGEPTAAAGETAGFGWLSLLPPLLAIALALILRDVVVALLVGVMSGSLLLYGPNPATAFARTVDGFVRSALADADHAAILIFSGLLGAMVGVMSRSGGTRGIVALLAPRATDSRRGQLAAWLMGIVVFFDDYANTLIVGPTLRPITDRLRISREKLAYIVDSTAAPIASLVPISTWIGVEIGVVASAFATIGADRSAFASVVASIPLRFYPLFALALGLAIALSQRDFGPMLVAERRAAGGEVLGRNQVPLADFTTRELTPPEDKPHRAINAVLPILTVIAVTIGGLIATGASAVTKTADSSLLEWLRDVLAEADSYSTLLWACFAGVTVAIVLAVAQRILRMAEATGAAIEGLKATLPAFVVLLLAWSLGAACDELGTAQYLVDLTQGGLPPRLVPTLIFVLAAAISFATGTSWGTMSILTPLAIPLAHNLSLSAGHAVGSGAYEGVLLGSVAAVLSGSIWGDHCSPISDTTILSSMASGCDHVAHVRTQLPYALVGGVLAVVLGTVPAAFGVPVWLLLIAGCAAIVALVIGFGKQTEVTRLESQQES